MKKGYIYDYSVNVKTINSMNPSGTYAKECITIDRRTKNRPPVEVWRFIRVIPEIE